MSEYPYTLDSIASHLKVLSKELAKLMDISEYDAWTILMDKLETKYQGEFK